MISPDPDDPLIVRRKLALVAAVSGIFVFPAIIIWSSVHLKTSDDLAKSLLEYMGTACMAPILAYLYAAHKGDTE